VNKDRTIRLVDEPLDGQEQGKDGEYMVADIMYHTRRGYVLHAYQMTRSTTSGRQFESMLLTNLAGGFQLVEPANRYSQRTLEFLAREAKEGGPRRDVLTALCNTVREHYKAKGSR